MKPLILLLLTITQLLSNQITCRYEEGHITKEIDGEGGEYKFAKSTSDTSTTYTYTNPQGNSYSSRDSVTTDGNYLFEITLPSGDSYSKTPISSNHNPTK